MLASFVIRCFDLENNQRDLSRKVGAKTQSKKSLGRALRLNAPSTLIRTCCGSHFFGSRTRSRYLIQPRGIVPENFLLQLFGNIRALAELRHGMGEITVAVRVIGSEYDPILT